MKPLTTRKGRTFLVLGDASVLTMDRLAIVTDRLDSDPRIASVSVVSHLAPGQEFLRATAPAGCAIAVATDVVAITGDIDENASVEELHEWSRRASERGLWHDWWLTPARDIARVSEFTAPAALDEREAHDLATAHYASVNTARMGASISLTIDATWLGPHQTGAQVLTTAAIEALAHHPQVSGIRLIGIESLPSYAQHLGELDCVELSAEANPQEISDVVWYPNQIDQRVDISSARSLGRRVITTYLDLIAYDIPRYHASEDAWAAYRSLQRRIALSVDGITAISADVAARLQLEVPRLDPERVQPIPLGLDHISSASSDEADGASELTQRFGTRPFVLVLGNDFHHKNRDFALQVWEEVLARGVNCDLVLAGLHVKSSSSQELEQAILSQHTNLRGTAHTLGHVSEAERAWLLANASAALYPSSAEGFGFVPYEAAAMGTPTTFTAFGPLAEISKLSDVPRTWSVDAYANDLQALLVDPIAAQSRVAALAEVNAELTWTLFADRFIDFARRIDEMPPVEGALSAGSHTEAAALASVLSSKTWRATAPLRRLGRRFTRS